MQTTGQQELFSIPHAERKSSPHYRNVPETDGLPGKIIAPVRIEDILFSLKKVSEDYLLRNAPAVLQTFLEFISLSYSSNYELRKHIRNIRAKYLFLFGDSERHISLEIKNSGMRTFTGTIDLPDITIKFRNAGVLLSLANEGRSDILNLILKQDVTAEGNLMYLFKFIYLLNHLQLKLMGPE